VEELCGAGEAAPFMRIKKHMVIARGTSALMVGAFLFTNVISAHAGENAFWAQRRGVAHRMKKDEFRQGERKSQNPLLAQLPQKLGTAPGGLDVIPSLKSSGPENQFPALGRSIPKGNMKEWGWLPELVAPFGTISELHLSSRANAPLIVHLQDAHEVEEAQRNLSGLVGALHANRGISLVGLEGAVGALDLAPYRSNASPDLTRGLADAFMKLGYLTGPEVAGIVSKKPASLWGIEDLPLYSEHVGAFRVSEKNRGDVQSKLATLSLASDQARDKIYSPGLRAIDDLRLAYLAHRLSLGDYALALSQTFNPKFPGDRRNRDERDPSSNSASNWELQVKGDDASFPNVDLLLEALKCERSLDFKLVEKERMRLVEDLVHRLSPASLDALVQESLNYRAGRLPYGVYLSNLRSLCRENAIGLDNYGPLNSYISYVLVAERINPSALLHEMEDLEKTVLMSLAQTADQRRLVVARRHLSLLEKMVLHSLTPAEWKSYQTERNGVLDLHNTLTQLMGQPVEKEAAITNDSIAPFELFCKLAMDRNDALVKNLLDKMRADKTRSAVFVAGGFHTEGVTQILRDEGVSYAVVTPRMTILPDNAKPLDVFARAPLPLETLLAGDVIHLAYAHLTEKSEQQGALSAAPDARLRKDTLQVGWVAIKIAIESELTKSADSTITSAFRSITHVSKEGLVFQDSLSGFLFKTVVNGQENQFKVVISPMNTAEDLFKKNGLVDIPSLKIDITVGNQTYAVRVYSAKKNSNVRWINADFGRLGRYVARSLAELNLGQLLVRQLKNVGDVFEVYQRQMLYLLRQEGLSLDRTKIHLEHVKRTTALAGLIAAKWNELFPEQRIDPNDPRLVLPAAAHDLGKLAPHLAKFFLGAKTYARDSLEYRALHDHEEAGFDVLDGSGLSVEKDVADVLRFSSSIHPDASPLPANSVAQELKIYAGMLLLADIFDAQLDLHRPYKLEQLRQGTLPTMDQIVGEFNRYLLAWEKSSEPSDKILAGQFRQLAASLIQSDDILRAIETTFFERAVETYHEHHSLAPVTSLDYQERFFTVLSSIREFHLYERNTPVEDWWPTLIDSTILSGAEGEDKSARLQRLGTELAEVVESGHTLPQSASSPGQNVQSLGDFLDVLRRGESPPPLSQEGADLLFNLLEKSLYRGGILPDVLKTVDSVFGNFFAKRFGPQTARFVVRIIFVPFWEDTIGGFKFSHIFRSTLVPLVLGHLLVSLAGENLWVGLVSAVAVFITGRLANYLDHPVALRKDAGWITLTSTVAALSIALWGGFTLSAVLWAYAAALAIHILVDAWLNRWIYKKEHAPGAWNQRLLSALSVVRLKNLLKELPFFVPPVVAAVLAEFITSGMPPVLAIAYQFTIGMTAVILMWPKIILTHGASQKEWLDENISKTPEDYRFRLFIGYTSLCLATITLMLYLPGVIAAGPYDPLYISFQYFFEKIILGLMAGGLVFHGIYNFSGRLFFGPSFVPAMGFLSPLRKGSIERLSVTVGKFRHLILRDNRAKISAHVEVSSEVDHHQRLILQLPAGQAALALTAHSDTPWVWNVLSSASARPSDGLRWVEITLRSVDQRKLMLDLTNILLLNVVSLRMQLFYGRPVREDENVFLNHLNNLSLEQKNAIQELVQSPLSEIIAPRVTFINDSRGGIRGVEIFKTTFDGRKHYRVIIDFLNGVEATLAPDGKLQLEGKAPIEIRLRMGSDDDPLTPIPIEKIFSLKARRAMAGDPSFRESAERFASLVYEEKLLAGSWMYPSYFGRDTLVAARLMWPALTIQVKKIIVQSVLDRLGHFAMEGSTELDGWVAVSDERNGEYLFHETVVEFNRLMAEGRQGSAVDMVRRALSGPRELPEFHVLDGNVLLTGLVSRFLQELEPLERQEFLAHQNARGESNLDSVLAHGNVLMHLTSPYVDGFQKHRDKYPGLTLVDLTKLDDFRHIARLLVRIQRDPHGQDFIGNWRDSTAALGFGKFPADINAFLIPNALASLDEILDLLGRNSPKVMDRVKEHGWPLLMEALEGRVVLSRARDAWSTAKAHFIVKLSQEEVRQRLLNYLAWDGHSTEYRKRLGLRLLAPGISVKDFVTNHGDPSWLKGGFVFTSVALDGEGHPVPIVNSDEVYSLLENDLPSSETRRLFDFWSRPFPVGLWSEAGALISNPVLTDNPYLWSVLGRQAYHGTVIWGWVTAALALGWARQFKITESPADRGKILQLLGDFLSLRRMLGPLAYSEAWSWELEADGRMTPAELIHGGESNTSGQPAVPIQLWSASAFSVDPNLEEASAHLGGRLPNSITSPRSEGVWQRLLKEGNLSPWLMEKWRFLKEDARQINRDRRARIPRHRRQLQDLAARGPPGGSRVAFLHFTAPPRVSGVDIVMTEQARWLARAGISVRVIAGNRSSEFDSVPHLDYMAIEGLSTMEEWEIDQQLEKVLGDQDVIVLHNVMSVPMNLGLTASLHRYISEHPEKYFILFVHNAMEREEPSYPLSLMNPTLALPHVAYVTVSKAYRDVIAVSYPRAPHFSVIPPGLWAYNPDYLTSEAAEDFTQNGLFNQDLVMLLPTRVDWNKDIPKALQITQALARRRPKTKLILVVPGVNSFDDLIRETRNNRDASAANWLEENMRAVAEKHVVFLDATRINGFPRHRQYLMDLMSLSHALLMPSRMESFGMPAIEAASVRTVVVASDLSPHRENLGKASPLFSMQETPEVIADRFLEYLDRHSLRDLGPLQRHVIDRFEWDNVMADQFLPVLEKGVESLPRVGTAVLLHRQGEIIRAYESANRIFRVLASFPQSWRVVVGDSKMRGIADIFSSFRGQYHASEDRDMALLRAQFIEPALAALAQDFPVDDVKVPAWLEEVRHVVLSVDVLRNDHRHTIALNTLGKFHLLAGRWKEAEAAYGESRRIDPHNHDAWLGLDEVSHQTNGKGPHRIGGMMFWLNRVWNMVVPVRFRMGEIAWQKSAFITEGLFSVVIGGILTAVLVSMTGDLENLSKIFSISVLGVFMGGHFADLFTANRGRAPPNIFASILITVLSAIPIFIGASPVLVVPLFFVVHNLVNRFFKAVSLMWLPLSGIIPKSARFQVRFPMFFGIVVAFPVIYLAIFGVQNPWSLLEAFWGMGPALMLATKKSGTISDTLEALREAYKRPYANQLGENESRESKRRILPSPQETVDDTIFIRPLQKEWPRLVALLEKQTTDVLNKRRPQRGRNAESDPALQELIQQAVLARSFLGGPAQGSVGVWGYTVNIELLRLRVARERATLDSQREGLTRKLGLSPGVGVVSLGQAAGRYHGSRSISVDRENLIGSDIETFLALAYAEGNGDDNLAREKVMAAVGAYLEAQNLFDAESVFLAAINTGKEIGLELTPGMLSVNSKTSPQEEAQWRRLNIISQAAREGNLKKHVRFLIPDGVTAREVQSVLESRGLSLGSYYLIKEKSAFQMEGGKYSVNKFVSWVAEDGGRLSDPGSIDIYLMDRSEWEWDNLLNRIRNNVRLLVDVLPGLVIDATNKIPDDLKRIVAINVAA
jgi:glycosyltransferase involved in cell wall biosynthesis